jgi:hypothetical protein
MKAELYFVLQSKKRCRSLSYFTGMTPNDFVRDLSISFFSDSLPYAT